MQSEAVFIVDLGFDFEPSPTFILCFNRSIFIWGNQLGVCLRLLGYQIVPIDEGFLALILSICLLAWVILFQLIIQHRVILVTACHRVILVLMAIFQVLRWCALPPCIFFLELINLACLDVPLSNYSCMIPWNRASLHHGAETLTRLVISMYQ